MAIISATNGRGRLSPKSESDQRRREEKQKQAAASSQLKYTLQEYEEKEIVRYCAQLFDLAQKVRKPHETFDTAWALFNGDMWRDRSPITWRAAITLNKIRFFIFFILAIMTDTKPRFSVEPVVDGSEDAADMLHKIVDRIWDSEDLQLKTALWILYGLIWGYSFIKTTYDPYANGGRGKYNFAVIPPYRIYTNRTTTCVDDAEYIIHVEDMTMGWIRRNFPVQAEILSLLQGISPDEQIEDRIRNRDYVREGQATQPRIISAANVNGNVVMPQAPMAYPYRHDDDHETVEVAEYWLKDDTLEEYEYQEVEDGQGVFEPVIENGEVVMEIVGTQTITNELDGQPLVVPKRAPKMKPKMKTGWRVKFPNGRLVVIAAGKVLLRDIPNPYQTDGLPFSMWKCYDVGAFQGQGEPLQLKSCAIAINKLASQVFEILEKTGNPSWKVKKGGVNLDSIKNRPGLVIPMENIADIQPLDKPPIPPEFFKLFELISTGMAEVAGINSAITGMMKTDNTAYATIDQLQESGSAPIRLKVRNYESGLAALGQNIIKLIQQYDNGDRPLRLSPEDEPGVVQPAAAVAVKFKKYKNVDIRGQVDFKVVPISSLSTSPSGVWNRWMTLIDKHLIDQTWWHKKFRLEGWRTELPRMLAQVAEDVKAQEAAKAASKPGPAPRSPARQAHRKRLPPVSNLPSREDNAMVR